MEIRKDKLVLDSPPYDILDEPLDTGDVLQHMLVRLADLALDINGGQ